MKIITIVAPQISPQALSAALPTDGVLAVTVTEAQSFNRNATTVQSYRGVKIANHFTASYRIEIEAEDSAVDQIVDGISFARAAGLFGDVTAWVAAPATVSPATPILQVPA